jgi:hypothetical protein
MILDGKELQKIAYQKYQLDWLKDNGESLFYLRFLFMNETDEIVEEDEWVDDFIEAHPTKNDQVFVSFNEFLVSEYLDRDYMQLLLNKMEFDLWELYTGEYDQGDEFIIHAGEELDSFYVHNARTFHLEKNADESGYNITQNDEGEWSIWLFTINEEVARAEFARLKSMFTTK